MTRDRPDSYVYHRLGADKIFCERTFLASSSFELDLAFSMGIPNLENFLETVNESFPPETKSLKKSRNKIGINSFFSRRRARGK